MSPRCGLIVAAAIAASLASIAPASAQDAPAPRRPAGERVHVQQVVARQVPQPSRRLFLGAVADAVEPPAGRECGAYRRRVERLWDLGEVVGVAGLDFGDAQRDHRAAPEVEHRLALLVGRANPHRNKTGRRRARSAAVLLEADDLSASTQSLADEHRARKHQAAVEEVATHALRRPG